MKPTPGRGRKGTGPSQLIETVENRAQCAAKLGIGGSLTCAWYCEARRNATASNDYLSPVPFEPEALHGTNLGLLEHAKNYGWLRLSRDRMFLLSLRDASIDFTAVDMPNANR